MSSFLSPITGVFGVAAGATFAADAGFSVSFCFSSLNGFAISSTILSFLGSPKIFLPNASAISSEVNAIPAIFPIAPIAPGALDARDIAAKVVSTYS